MSRSAVDHVESRGPASPHALAALLASVSHVSWFASLGDALTDSERADMAAYLAGLALGAIAVAPVADWASALRIASDPAWDARWWQAEERARQTLMQQALMRQADAGAPETLERLSAVALAAHEATIGPAAMAAASAGVADPAAVRAASGAATQACYQGALALIAGAGPEHPFAAKLRLFQAGRWPLGIVAGTAYIF